MFSFLHVFSFATATEGTFLNVVLTNAPKFFSLFCLHCLFYLITKKYKSLIPAVIIHFMWDFVLFILV
jgi:membrane protease YdiL (CAAX protease family)